MAKKIKLPNQTNAVQDVKIADVVNWLDTTVKILRDLAKPKSNSKK